MMQGKKLSNKTKLVVIFGATFLIVFILIFQVANILSPNVDVEIADDTDDNVEKEEDVKKMIDERLKWIQFEDNEMPAEDKKDKEEAVTDDELSDDADKINEEKVIPDGKAPEVTAEKIKEETKPQKQETQKPAPANELHVYKVYIGSFATIEQAMSAQDKITEANIGITPYIKGIDNKFTLQAGSFANKQKAEAQAQLLSQYGIGARIIEE